MESYIDWTGKTQTGTNFQPPSSQPPLMQSPSPGVFWQQDHKETANTVQNPYNVDTVENRQSAAAQDKDVNHVTDHGQRTFRQQYSESIMSPSLSPSLSHGADSHYGYTTTLHTNATHQSQPPVLKNQTSGASQQQQQQSQRPNTTQQYHQPQQAFPNPYSYANSANPYNDLYPQRRTQTPAGYIAPYNGQANPSAPQYPGYHMGSSTGQQMPSINQQLQFQQYQQSPANGYMPAQPAYQYQRPEDALQRVHQQAWAPQYQYPTTQGANIYAQWQAPPVGQTVYFPMDTQPPAPKTKPKVEMPSSPIRPTEPLEALRYDVSQCLMDYNTSRDLKGCAAALLAIMATCDPVVISSPSVDPVASASDNAVSEKISSPRSLSAELDPKVKQSTLLSVVSAEIKGAMIEEASNNKSIRAKLRTWFVRAHKDNSYVVLKAIISVLDKLTFLSARLLAEVKFGKALVIVSRKCEDKDVRESLAQWVPKAEESLVVERDLEIAASKAPALEEEPKKKKAKVLPSSSATKSVSKTSPPSKASEIPLKNGAELKAKSVVKKAEPVAKSNTAFFKKEIPSVQKTVIAKPGMAAALAGIKARKRTDPVDGEMAKHKSNDLTSLPAQPATLPKVLPIVKPSFSALKLVEGLKRTASPSVVSNSEPESKKRKQKKTVSWRPEAELEQVRIFEAIEPEDGFGDVAHTPHEYGNARDLDRKEGELLHGGVLPDREEDFIDWEVPTYFSHKDLVKESDSRGPKKAGTMRVYSKSNESEEEREKTVSLAVYSSEGDIPWNPSEKEAANDMASIEVDMPKLIPLPLELRNDWRVQQTLGHLLYVPEAMPTALALNPATATGDQAAQVVVESKVEPDIAAILAGIMASQKSTALPQTNEIHSTSGLQDTSSGTINNAALQPPPPPLIPFDPKLAEFLAKMAAANSGPGMPPPPDLHATPPGSSNGFPSMPMPPMPPMPMPPMPSFPSFQPEPAPYQHFDVRPWVRYNDNGKYREPCRFLKIGKCEKGDRCPYIHPP